MLKKLGFKKYAYDWRAEHLPTFDEEVGLLKKAGIELTAVWFPANLGRRREEAPRRDREAQGHAAIVGHVRRPARARIRPRRWRPPRRHSGRSRRRPAKLGCKVALYNHGGWSGEPENQIAVIEALKLKNVGIVYNQHHGHDHLDRFPELLKTMKPHLLALNLNGMVKGGDKVGKKILPLGAGDLDLELLKVDSRQRLHRADRHPRPHAGRRGRTARGQSRRAGVAEGAARREAGSREAEVPDVEAVRRAAEWLLARRSLRLRHRAAAPSAARRGRRPR